MLFSVDPFTVIRARNSSLDQTATTNRGTTEPSRFSIRTDLEIDGRYDTFYFHSRCLSDVRAADVRLTR